MQGVDANHAQVLRVELNTVPQKENLCVEMVQLASLKRDAQEDNS